jgi:hypothetical protein
MQCPFAAAEAGGHQTRAALAPHWRGLCVAVAVTVTVQSGVCCPSPRRCPSIVPRACCCCCCCCCCTHRLHHLLPRCNAVSDRTSGPSTHHRTSRHRPTRIRSQHSFKSPASLPTAPACRHRRPRASSLSPSPPPRWTPLRRGGSCHKAHPFSILVPSPLSCVEPDRRPACLCSPTGAPQLFCTSPCECALACPLGPVLACLVPPFSRPGPGLAPCRCSLFSILDNRHPDRRRGLTLPSTHTSATILGWPVAALPCLSSLGPLARLA